MQLTKIDIEILHALYSCNMITEMQSYRVSDILDVLVCKPAYYTISKHIRKLLIPLGYVSEGMRDSRANTYYITDTGITYLHSIGVINNE